MTKTAASLEAQWARVGVLFNCAPAGREPDLERLLLETARGLGGNARLLPLVVTWLVEFNGFVAKHRLKRLAAAELEGEASAGLGLLLDAAIGAGASAELAVARGVCRPLKAGRPLTEDLRADGRLAGIAERHASGLSRRWGLWTPDVVLKTDAVRPAAWLLSHNPGYAARIIRKGDLRCSILETLRRDMAGRARSESELTRLSGATRTAVRKALAALVLEGEVTVGERKENERDHAVELRRAA
ncbi:MAG: hypothetical protein ACREJO_10720 [Phycisphaerales bacterium]